MIEKYLSARDKGLSWLLNHLNTDGSLGDPAEGFRFSRAPWTFTVTGATAAAAAVCGWVRRQMLTADGDFGGPYRVLPDAYAYRNATYMLGAHLAGQYDLSFAGLPLLERWQDDRSGGVAADLLPNGRPSDNLDIPYSCGVGFAFLALGRLDRARAVAAFLKTLYDAQPALPDRFYYCWSRERQGLITGYLDEHRLWYVVENQAARKQRWTVGGIAAAFLGRLYLAEPDPAYLALARAYQAFSMAATPRQFDYPQVCKSSWGSSLLYQITGEDQYRVWTERLGDWYASTQQSDGSWLPAPGATVGGKIELTLEFVMHLDTLIGALSSRDALDVR